MKNNQEISNSEGNPRCEPAARFVRFSEAYARSGNAYRAALEAGYSERMAKSKSYLLAKRVRQASPSGKVVSKVEKNRNAAPAGFLPRRLRLPRLWVFRTELGPPKTPEKAGKRS